MACRYTYQGKTYEAHEFDDVLRAMAPSIAAEYMPSVRGIPSAPFIDSTDKWLTLALKRVMVMAAQEGYDRVAFVNGEQSAERYDLSKQLDRLEYKALSNGNYVVMGRRTGSGESTSFTNSEGVNVDRLEELVGKEMTKKIVGGEGVDGERPGWKKLDGLDLKVGGQGMIAFYDKIVPAAVNKLLGKVGGGKVETVRLSIAKSDANGEL